MPGSSSGGRPSVEMQRKQARPPSTATMPSPRVLFGEMPTPTPTVEDPFYAQFMENVIYEGRGEAFQMGGHGDTFDPEETQSQDGRGQYVADEDFEADDHGDSWHEDDDIYSEGEGDEEEEDGVDIAGEPLFIDELTQRAEAQKRKKSIRTGSYTQDEDKLICESWKEIGQDEDKLICESWKEIGLDEEQMKQYMELQTKKLEMEEAAKKRKIDMEEAARQRQLDIEAANAADRQRQLDIEAANAATKAKEVALAIMSVDLSKMSEKTRSWFEARQKEMFDADGLN
jgi:hypothetical protein